MTLHSLLSDGMWGNVSLSPDLLPSGSGSGDTVCVFCGEYGASEGDLRVFSD